MVHLYNNISVSPSNNKAMKAIIMAGGEGRRLKAVTGSLPKPMVPLLGKPLMERTIELLTANGITDICAALGYNPAPIIEHFGDGAAFGAHLCYRIEDKPLGTAGGVKNCMDFIGDEPFLVLSGDAACDFELGRLVSEHERRRPAVTMALYESRDPLRYGLVVPDANGSVRCFIEKPPWERVVTDLVNTGIYVIEPRAMELVPEGESFDFASGLFPKLLERGDEILGLALEGYWCDIGTPRAYFQCCLDALDGVLKLPDVPAEAPPKAEHERRKPLGRGAPVERRVGCRDRAKLMRRISETMMEAGAALDDGICLKSEHCALRISPDPDHEEIRIETSARDAAFSGHLADALEGLANSLNE